MIRPAALALLTLPLLAGCAQPSGRFPSLLPRAIETRSDAEPVQATPAVVADPALDAKLSGFRELLAGTAAAFAPSEEEASTLAQSAKGAPIGSDAWLSAQAALADLDAIRAQSLTALTEIEQLTIERSTAGLPPYPALDELRRAAQAQLDAQTQQIDALEPLVPKA